MIEIEEKRERAVGPFVLQSVSLSTRYTTYPRTSCVAFQTPRKGWICFCFFPKFKYQDQKKFKSEKNGRKQHASLHQKQSPAVSTAVL